ncbi:L,D-transpeptidase [Gammaproteobacteria bacterium]|nr:L,D-transpeptidase [Gammaproteobacteria bacterium]
MVHLKASESLIYINIQSQILKLFFDQKIHHFHISSSKYGLGEQLNSHKTPRGWHYIRFIIGKKLPKNTCFQARRPCANSDISGRILWLQGLQPGFNKGTTCSLRRYIYIHGTPKTFLKAPISIGCINMINNDIKKLTDLIPKYCKVYIDEK